MSEQWQEDEASLQNYNREQADLERQTDALVLTTLTSLASAAKDLKARLRRDTDSLLEEYRRTRRGLENDISMAGAERQRLRDEAEAERDRILSDARNEAQRVVTEAHLERESLLGEVREMEQRLRALEAQILEVLGAASSVAAGGGSSVGERRMTSVAPADPSMVGAAPGVTTSPSPALADSASMFAQPTTLPPAVDVEDDAAADDFEVDTTSLGEPGPADHLEELAATTPDESPAEVDRPAASAPSIGTGSAASMVYDEPAPAFATPEPAVTQQPAPPPTRTDEAVEVPAAPTPPVPPAAAASVMDTTPPAEESASAAARGLQLVFDGVPGYQQAAAIERAVGDLVEDGEVEIIEFEQGQLVLQVEASNPRALADRLMARPPLPMRLVASGQDSATFQLTAG